MTSFPRFSLRNWAGHVVFCVAAAFTVFLYGGSAIAYGESNGINEPNPAASSNLECTYSLPQSSTLVMSSGGQVAFSVVADPGCAWTATTAASWISITGASGTGNGAVSLNVAPNSLGGPPRTGTVSVGGQTYTVSQAGSCFWSFNPQIKNVPATAGTYTISTGPNTMCDFRPFLSNGNPWITNLVADVAAQTLTYTVAANPGGERQGVIVIGAAAHNVVQASSIARRTAFDFDGDGKTDMGIFRPSVGEWWYRRSSDSVVPAFQFGGSTDKIVPGDYTNDAKADIAFWRPSTGEWFILRSEDSSYYSFPFGATGDVPVPADYDGDGRVDAAVFRPSTNTWFINKSGGGTTITTFGAAGDQPVAADYDGDGKTDIAIYRPSTGDWWIQRTSAGLITFRFGAATDKPVPGDYTGDGKADAAFWRPSTGEWFIVRSENLSTFYSFPFGANGDVPAPGDYDGDAKFDAAVFRASSSTWYVQRSTAGTQIVTFGANGDKPVANAYVP